jgi:hypothetical protein
MNAKLFLIFLSPFLLSACQFLDKQVPNKEELLKKELQSINWNQVDEYPSFAQCDSLTDPKANQTCFFDYLTQLIQARLGADTLSLMYPDLDTIQLKITVMPNATFTFEPQVTDTIAYNKTLIDSVFKARLVGFPKVNPAIKRGLPVKTQFVLPVVLHEVNR